MPEWNLVKNENTRTIWFTIRSLWIAGTVFCLCLTLQSGCSRIKSAGLRDLVDQQPDLLDWVDDPSQTEKSLIEEPDAFESLKSENVVSRSESKFWMPPKKLEVSQTEAESELGLAQHQSVDNGGEQPPCELGCSCASCASKSAPRLPFAEPVEPPQTVEIPPAGIIGQPLSPILFNSDTRAVRVDSNSDLRTSAASSIERRVNVDSKDSSELRQDQQRLSLVKPISNPIRLASREAAAIPASNHPQSEIQNSTSDLSDVLLTKLSEELTSDSASRRRSAKAGLQAPIVESSKLANAAGIAIEEADPPFAEFPPLELSTPAAQPSQNQDFVAPNLEMAKADQLPVTEQAPDDSTDFVAPDGLGSDQSQVTTAMAALQGAIDFAAARLNTSGQPIPVVQSGWINQHSQASAVPVARSNLMNSFENLSDEEFAELFSLPMDSLTGSQTQCPGCGALDCRGCEQPDAGLAVEKPAQPKLPAIEVPGFVAQVEPAKVVAESGSSDVGRATEFEPGIPKLRAAPKFPAVEIQGSPNVAQAQPIETEIQPTADGHSSEFSPASHTEQLTLPIPSDANWQVQVDQAIDTLKRELINEDDARIRQTHEINLQVLQLLKKHVAASDQDNPMSEQQQKYWQHQLDAITAMAQSDRPDEISASTTLVHLRQAVERLEQVVGLKLANAEFCSEVKGFGQIKPFASTQFGPSQRMLVYCEVENYQPTKVETDGGTRFVTKLRGSIMIRDGQGRVVQENKFPTVEDVALNKRRDFYMYFPVKLDELPAGEYQLELEVEDLTAERGTKIQPAMSFSVHEN